MIRAALSVCLLSAIAATADAQIVYATASPGTIGFADFQGVIASERPIDISGINEAFGLARDPISGEIYAVVAGADAITRINPFSGEGTTPVVLSNDSGTSFRRRQFDIGFDTTSMSEIAFDVTGQLWGIIGNNSGAAFNTLGEIVLIDPDTGVATSANIPDLSGRGNTIEFGLDGRTLYHFYDDRVRAIDPDAATVLTDIQLTGHPVGAVQDAAAVAGGFIAYNRQAQELIFISLSGEVSLLATSTMDAYGLIVFCDPVSVQPTDPADINADNTIDVFDLIAFLQAFSAALTP